MILWYGNSLLLNALSNLLLLPTKPNTKGSAFVHFNTGITELEYFGQGRFLLMCSNQTPHILPDEYAELRTGGSLKDGWSYLVPNDEIILDIEVSVAFSDEVLDEHVKEQKEALKALYLSSQDAERLSPQKNLSVEEDAPPGAAANNESGTADGDVHFVVRRGLQVVGVATYAERSGHLYDVAVRPSARNEVAETLLKSVKDHAKRIGRSGSLLVRPRSQEGRGLFQQLGFKEKEAESTSCVGADGDVEMELNYL